MCHRKCCIACSRRRTLTDAAADTAPACTHAGVHGCTQGFPAAPLCALLAAPAAAAARIPGCRRCAGVFHHVLPRRRKACRQPPPPRHPRQPRAPALQARAAAVAASLSFLLLLLCTSAHMHTPEQQDAVLHSMRRSCRAAEQTARLVEAGCCTSLSVLAPVVSNTSPRWLLLLRGVCCMVLLSLAERDAGCMKACIDACIQA